jgi:hypothetical protein
VDRKRFALVAAVVVAALAAIVVLLFTGGAEPVPTFEDLSGDANVEEGKNPPGDTSLADILRAAVTEDGGDIVFEAQLGATVPNEVEEGSFGLRWEVHEQGDSTFLITANLDVGPTASIIGEQNGYGASTLDETLPGNLEVDGDTITIRIQPSDIPDFPDEFAWVLQSSLDGDQGDPTSARAEDRAPDSGFGEYPVD